MVKVLIVIAILALIAFVAFGQYVGVRNTLVTKNEAVKAAWSQVDIVLQRRADLIPNLVETVKGYRPAGADRFWRYRQSALGVALRRNSQRQDCRQPATRRRPGPPAGHRGELSQLKSNENFLRLQDELAGTENRIAVERKRYNDTLQDYNTYIQHFPNNIFAGWAGFKPNDAYFAASEGSRTGAESELRAARRAPQAAPQPAPAH